jgi:hypothetical protein
MKRAFEELAENVGDRPFPLRKYRGQKWSVAASDGNYCVWLAKEKVLEDFTAFVASLPWVPWLSQDKEAFAAAVAPTKAEFMVTRDAPFLFRDSLLQVFEKLRNFYDLHACSQVCRHWLRVSKLPQLRPWNGLEGWGLTVLSFGSTRA